ncbi:hypothetical protein AJ80_04550 [Polytolypa hystricis UAMH7299]|uniref:Large ribosomal subunit protein bL21m n=1 Tax=Polytolypa hystricis (strain UAMH7299) TaxID=1447883 RepID=A0A2B7YAV0_POLH7|nr:hypothetical protein AJ80_04550 [Polytolypa hystricis UAMH7299]
MLSRSFRTALDARWSALPFQTTIVPARRACLHQASSTTQFQATQPEVPPESSSINNEQAQPSSSAETSSGQEHDASISVPQGKLPIPPTFTAPLKLTPSLTELLPLLATQTPHYITAHLHARPYLVTAGDTVRLPFLMADVYPGDILRFNRASNVGSRDFTLKGAPYVDERLFECRLRVLGTESEPLRIKEKTKRRQRHVQKIKSKHKYTILRVMDVKVKGVDELVKEGAEVVKE